MDVMRHRFPGGGVVSTIIAIIDKDTLYIA